MAATHKLIWIDEGGFHGWGCSECVWVFTSSDALTGKSFDELMRNFEAQRDKEFASHVCRSEGGFHGWGCSECVWVFTSSDALTGKSFDELMRNFEAQRDKEFASHVCAEHPRTKSAKR